MLKIAVLASGKGSNFMAILDAIEYGNIHNAEIVSVISDRMESGALHLARMHNIPAYHLNRNAFGSDEEHAAAINAVLTRHEVNFIVLAGYLKKIDASIIKKYKNRIVNIHPALLPKYGGKGMYGLRVHEAVIAGKEKTSGATVHIVDEEYDRGPIVLQKSVDIAEDDTPSTLAAKVLLIEHEIYPEVIRLFAEGIVHIDDNNNVTFSS